MGFSQMEHNFGQVGQTKKTFMVKIANGFLVKWNISSSWTNKKNIPNKDD